MLSKRDKRRPSFSPTPISSSSINRTPLGSRNTISSGRKGNVIKSVTPRKPLSQRINLKELKQLSSSVLSKQSSADFYAIFLQYESSPQARFNVIEWMADICNRYRLPRIVLYTAVNLFDRAMLRIGTTSNNLKVFSGACILLSAKMHTPGLFKLSNLIKECTLKYESEEFIKQESSILESVNYDLQFPCVNDFLSIITMNITENPSLLTLIWYFADMQLQFTGFLRFQPITISIAAVLFSFSCLHISLKQSFLKELVKDEDFKNLWQCIETFYYLSCQIHDKSKFSYIEKTNPNLFSQASILIGEPHLPKISSYQKLFPSLC